MLRNLCLFVLFVRALVCQESSRQHTMESLAPSNHDCEIVLNVAAVLNSGLNLQAMRLDTFAERVQQRIGLKLEAIREVRWYTTGLLKSNVLLGAEVLIVEGHSELKLHPPEGYARGELSGCGAFLPKDGSGDRDRVYVLASPQLMVHGGRLDVQRLLERGSESKSRNPLPMDLIGEDDALLRITSRLNPAMFSESRFGASSKLTPPKVGALNIVAKVQEDGTSLFYLNGAMQFTEARDSLQRVAALADWVHGSDQLSTVLGRRATFGVSVVAEKVSGKFDLGSARELESLVAAVLVNQIPAAVVRAKTRLAVTVLRGIHEAAEMFQLMNAQTELTSLRQLTVPDERGKRWLITSSDPPQDPWGHAYVLRKAATGQVEVLSAGPDGVLGTDDDLVHPSPRR